MRETKMLLFVLCAVWTIVQMTLLFLEFLGFPYIHFPTHMPSAYYVLLGVYAFVKESARWGKKNLQPYHGEWFFVGWWVFALVLYTMSAVTNGRYAIPTSLSSCCEFVSIVYIASSVSKLLNRVRCIEVRIYRYRNRRKGVDREAPKLR